MTPIAIVVLNQASVPLARKLAIGLSGAILHGLAGRTEGVDVTFTEFCPTVQTLFSQGTALIGFCATGILIRTVAPLLADKWQEPPVLAVAEDGSAVVPLLGGLRGANDLARQVAAVLQVVPAITTAGDLRFRTALLSPPIGYRLAHRQTAKRFIADLLAGARVRLIGEAAWLRQSPLAFDAEGSLTIQITERSVAAEPGCLVYCPLTVAIALDRAGSPSGDALNSQIAGWIDQLLARTGLAVAAVAGLFVAEELAADPQARALGRHYDCPVRYLDLEARDRAVEMALEASRAVAVRASESREFGGAVYTAAIAVAEQPIDPDQIGSGSGQLQILGLGPGGVDWMSAQVRQVLAAATDWVGYSTYLDLIEPLRTTQRRHDSDNRQELYRASFALDLAAEGRCVALVSSGDPGIFGMAAAVFEVIDHDPRPEWQRVEIQVCPGISAMQAAASLIGAPLGHDLCTISLSDILKPWQVIEQRLAAAAQADFVIAIYNPVSSGRQSQLERAREVLLRWRSPQTPLVVARKVGRPGQALRVKALQELTHADVDMQTVLIVGSSRTRILQRPGGQCWVYTPRRYDL